MKSKGAAAALLAQIVLSWPVHAETAAEYTVKAAFLYKFAPFIEWPLSAFPTASTPLAICIAGDDPFGTLADQVVESQGLGHRSAILRRISSAETGEGCHIMFIGQNGGSPASVRNRPILTVTDGERNADEKGVIHFVIRSNRVRFQIDEYAAQQSGLSVSSKLLSLADSVRPRG